jgi:hypothetical protein
MTRKQEEAIRRGVLRILLHPASGLVELIDGLPDGDLRECIDVVTETLSARVEVMFERAKQRKLAL